MSIHTGIGIFLCTQGIGQSIAPELLLSYCYLDNGQVSRSGPDPVFSYTGALPDGQGGTDSSGNPQAHDEGVWSGPGFANLVPVGREDFSLWNATDATVSGDTISFSNIRNARILLFLSGLTIGDVIWFCIELRGTPGETISIEVDTGSVQVTLSAEYQRFFVSQAITVASPGLRVIRRTDADALTVDARFPQTTHDYIFPYIPPGTTVVSAAATTGGNGVNFDIDASSSDPRAVAIHRAFDGKPDGVELVTGDNFTLDSVGDFVADDATLSVASNILTITYSAATQRLRLPISGLTIGTRYQVTGRVRSSNSTDTIAAGFSPAEYGDTINLSPQFQTVTANVVATATSHDFGFFSQMTAGESYELEAGFSVQALNPAVVTASALVTMGVGSDELVGDSVSKRLLGIQDGSGNLLFYRGDNVEADSQIVHSTDGVAFPGMAGTWARGEIHRKVVQTNEAGTQFRVGNQRLNADGSEIDSDILWSSYVAFDGSFDPLDFLRVALGHTVPLWIRAINVWDKVATDDEIIQGLCGGGGVPIPPDPLEGSFSRDWSEDYD